MPYSNVGKNVFKCKAFSENKILCFFNFAVEESEFIITLHWQ